ncbi:MAG: hypothetical protein RL076_1242 [Chloroflexota bacterium]
MNTTRLYRFIVMMTIGVMCITSIWTEPNAQSVGRCISTQTRE